jgi:hypothetical protein
MNSKRSSTSANQISQETTDLTGSQPPFEMSIPVRLHHECSNAKLEHAREEMPDRGECVWDSQGDIEPPASILNCEEPLDVCVLARDSATLLVGRHKQIVLQKACRRIGKSSSGSKEMLVRRLFDSSYESYESVQELAREFDDSGKVGHARERAANWTANDSARLAHVLVDPSNATALTRLVSRASREELDVGLRDPWSE